MPFMLSEILIILAITCLPWIELRGAIPFGIAMGMNPLLVFISVIIINALIFFPVFFILKFLYKYMERFNFIRNIIEKTRKRGEKYIEKYGVLGLAIFIGIPLPFTGVYSGTVLAWLFNMNWKKAFLSAALGVLIAGTIVMALSLGIYNMF